MTGLEAYVLSLVTAGLGLALGLLLGWLVWGVGHDG